MEEFSGKVTEGIWLLNSENRPQLNKLCRLGQPESQPSLMESCGKGLTPRHQKSGDCLYNSLFKKLLRAIPAVDSNVKLWDTSQIDLSSHRIQTF